MSLRTARVLSTITAVCMVVLHIHVIQLAYWIAIYRLLLMSCIMVLLVCTTSQLEELYCAAPALESCSFYLVGSERSSGSRNLCS